jgi:hypothetical protein
MSLVVAFLTCAGLVVIMTPPASAEPNVKVSVTLQRIRALASSEEGLCGTLDWYAKVWINGQEFNNEDSPSQDELEGNADISPDWEFSKEVDVATLDQSDGVAKVPVKIEVWDEDGFLCLGDDQYDASPTASKAIEFSVGVAPCRVFMGGDDGSGCEGSIISSGTESDRAEVTFGVNVEEPASAPGLRIQCTHDPIWPYYNSPVSHSLFSTTTTPRRPWLHGSNSTAVPRLRWSAPRSASRGHTPTSVTRRF